MKVLAFDHYVGKKVNTISKNTPDPSEDEVLIKVKFSALDTAIDPVINKEIVGRLLHKITNPLFLGYHYSGSIEKVGAGVEGFKTGDEVFGHLQYTSDTEQGSLSEYITVKGDTCALAPKNVDLGIVAASTTEVLTALQGLRDHGGLQITSDRTSPQSILVNGAAGGVGSAAVQIAVRAGAHVTAICSTKDVNKVKEMGAKVVIDRLKTSDPYHSCLPGQFDTIFDTANALPAAKSLRFLKKKGALVLTAPTPGHWWGFICSLFSRKKMTMLIVKSQKSDLDLLRGWLQDSFKIFIDSVYPIKDIEKALVRNREKKKGRVVVQVENGW